MATLRLAYFEKLIELRQPTMTKCKSLPLFAYLCKAQAALFSQPHRTKDIKNLNIKRNDQN
jgi:hypothetical protein